jgi:hypothetical protein
VDLPERRVNCPRCCCPLTDGTCSWCVEENAADDLYALRAEKETE